MTSVLPTRTGLSAPVLVAAGLELLSALFGIAVAGLGLKLLTVHDDLLLVVIPVVAGALLLAGAWIATMAVGFGVRLLRRAPGSRFQTALLGAIFVFVGAASIQGFALVGLGLVAYGAALVLLMTTRGAARDLGGWQPAVLGRPGTAPWHRRPRPTTTAWEPAAPPRTPQSQSQPAPGSPEARVEELARAFLRHDEPRPWWEHWHDGLSQGMPLWELLLAGAGVLACLVGNVAVLAGLTHPGARPYILLLPLGFPPIWFVERRMKGRLRRR